MRRIIWIAWSVLAACSGGSLFNSDSATEIALATALANAGVRQCVDHQPPPFAACAGKKAGDPCQVADDDDADMQARMCKALHDGRLVCVGLDDDDDDVKEAGQPSSPPLAACAGKSAGAACALAIANQSKAGICRAFERDENEVLACVPAPSEPDGTPPIAACGGKAAGDACTVQREDKTFTGVCHALPSGVLLCLPPPPSPPQAAVDACASLQADAACSFVFGEHTFQGACVLEPDGKTLVCAPVCKAPDA
jgi:hypothetical protein